MPVSALLNGVDQYFSVASALLTGAPVTVSQWINKADTTTFQVPFCISKTNTTVEYFALNATNLTP